MNPKFLALAACSLLLTSQLVFALASDKEQPIKINAGTQHISLKDGVTTYASGASLTQGSLKLEAEKITLIRSKNQDIQTVIAEGNPAKYQQTPDDGKATVHAEASSITYQVDKEQLILDKNVSVEQDGTITRGGRIEYDTKEQVVRASKGDNNPDGRVETIIPAKNAK